MAGSSSRFYMWMCSASGSLMIPKSGDLLCMHCRTLLKTASSTFLSQHLPLYCMSAQQ